jgi:hypothetical protein
VLDLVGRMQGGLAKAGVGSGDVIVANRWVGLNDKP